MEAVLEIDDSEDEACVYLKTVKTESVNYARRRANLGDSVACEDSFVPQSQIPQDYQLPLSTPQKSQILSKFSEFRVNLREHITAKEKRRSKALIKKTLYENKPLIEIIKELDQLAVMKILKCIEEWINDYEKLEEWTYCMLVMLDTPLPLDLYSVLNKIMVKAIEFSPKPSALVIITIISEFYGQKLI